MYKKNEKNLINLSSRLSTFVLNFSLNFTRLLLRSLVLRSFLCVLFYLVFGINTAYAWVDYNGVEHDDTVDRIEILPIQNTNSFRIYNRLTGQSYSSEEDFSRYSEYARVASYSNNQEEFEANWKEFRNRQGLDIPPNIPTEDPSNSPISATNNEETWVDKEGVVHSMSSPRWRWDNDSGDNGEWIHLERDHRPRGTPSTLRPELGFGPDVNPNKLDNEDIQKKVSYQKLLQNTIARLDARLELESKSNDNFRSEEYRPSPRHLNFEERLKKLDEDYIARGSNNLSGSTILSVNHPILPEPNVYSPGKIPPLPNNINLPTFKYSSPNVQPQPLNIPQVANLRPIGLNPPVVPPVVPVSTPSESWYSGVLDSVCEKISNFTSVFSYLTGSRDIGANLRSNVESVVPSKTSVLTSVAISVIGIGVHFLVNTYMGDTSKPLGTFVRKFNGHMNRDELAEWYMNNPTWSYTPWEKIKYYLKQPTELTTAVDHFNGDYWSFAEPTIKAIAPLVLPAIDNSILAGFPLIGGISQATGYTPTKIAIMGSVAAAQALATVTGTTFSGVLSNMFARLTAVNMSVLSAIGSSISWAWSKLSVAAVKQAASVLKGSGNLVVNGLQAAGIISAQTAAQINAFRSSTNKKIQDWLLGSGGSALFGKLFGSEGSKQHAKFTELLKKLDGDFPWLELLMFITMGLYIFRILWSFRKSILRLAFRRFLL